MTVRKVITWGDPKLKVKSEDVGHWTPTLEQLVIDLFETALEMDGVGLAAPQVGININIAVIDTSCGIDPNSKLVLINPEITNRYGSQKSSEGCLSVPGIYEIVDRPKQICIKNRKPDGSWEELRSEDSLARTICHEVDHLRGILFFEYFGPVKRQIIQRRYNKQRSHS
jgi:peptide deformylase